MRFFIAMLMLAAAAAGQTPSAAARKPGVDKKTLEVYLRHLELWPDQITVRIGDPQPSSMPEFSTVEVRASVGERFQDLSYLVSKDGRKILKAKVFDLGDNPFRSELNQLKTEFSPSLGTPGATAVIVLFSDFQCGYCKEESTVLRQNLLATYPKEVRLYFKDYPLAQIHPWAKTAAIAGRCVFRQEAPAFWDFHDWAFGNQSAITPENFKGKFLDFARGRHLDEAKLGACLDSRATEAEVEKTMAEGRALGINSTPTMYVNGRPITAAIPWENLKQIIDLEIRYQKVAKNAGEDCGCEVKLPSLTGTK